MSTTSQHSCMTASTGQLTPAAAHPLCAKLKVLRVLTSVSSRGTPGGRTLGARCTVAGTFAGAFATAAALLLPSAVGSVLPPSAARLTPVTSTPVTELPLQLRSAERSRALAALLPRREEGPVTGGAGVAVACLGRSCSLPGGPRLPLRLTSNADSRRPLPSLLGCFCSAVCGCGWGPAVLPTSRCTAETHASS